MVRALTTELKVQGSSTACAWDFLNIRPFTQHGMGTRGSLCRAGEGEDG